MHLGCTLLCGPDSMMVFTFINEGCPSFFAASMAAISAVGSAESPSATLCVPSVRFVSFRHVFREGEVGAAVDGDVIVVVEHDGFPRPGAQPGLKPRQKHLPGDNHLQMTYVKLLKISNSSPLLYVAAMCFSAMLRPTALRSCPRGQWIPLPGEKEIFWMASRDATQLAELLEVCHGWALVSRKMRHRV